MTSILPLLEQTHLAASSVRRLSDADKKALLNRLADLVEENQAAILAANQIDLDKKDDADPKKDRLMLNPARLKAIADSIRDVANLPSPAGQVLAERTLPNGILLRKVAVPLGVVGIIYESFACARAMRQPCAAAPMPGTATKRWCRLFTRLCANLACPKRLFPCCPPTGHWCRNC